MKLKSEIWYYAAIIGVLLLIVKTVGIASYNIITDWLIPEFEGFSPNPFWDNAQYTWGYGTKAPGPYGIITKTQALRDMRTYLKNDYFHLKPLLTRELTAQQWAAFLSFSYNEGFGGARNLIADINSKDDKVLEIHWKKYVYVAGKKSDGLVERRNKEWSIWMG